MKIDVIIPFHGKTDLLFRCLKALALASPIDGIVYIIDDGSPIQDAVLIKQSIVSLPLPIQWLTLPHKSGFVAAVNYAWTQSDHEYLVILNNDTIPAPGLIQKLSYILEHYERIAAVGPTSDNPTDLFQFRPLYNAGPSPNPSFENVKINSIPYLTGMCLAIRRRAICEEYLFDPLFSPGYFEDLDLSCRLRADGWCLSVLEDCRIHHTGRSTFGSESNLEFIIARNYETFVRRWSHFHEHNELDFLLHNVKKLLAQRL